MAYDALARYRPDAPPPRWPFALTLAVFSAAYLALFCVYVQVSRGPMQSILVDLLTVRPAALLIAMLDPGGGVYAEGARLAWPGGRLSVLSGCDGVETMILLASAMLVARIDPRARALGIALGCALIYAMNQLRLAALYFLYRARSDWFDPVHVGVAPLVLIAAITVFYLWWTARFRRDADEPLAQA
jgi:exosortase family protein XrtM